MNLDSLDEFDLQIDSDNRIQLTGLVDNDTGSYINDATVHMSLFKLAARKKVWILTPNVVATAGTWTLTYLGQTTAAIAWNATLWEVQGALESLNNIIEGDLIVGGQMINAGTGGLTIEFAESFTDVDAITFSFAALTGPTNALSTMIKTTKNLFAGPAVNKGGGKVGLPCIRHGAASGDYIRIEGTVNYDGEYTVDATTSANEIVVTATYVAETMTSNEELFIGITNGTEIALAYVAASDGNYLGMLPDTLKGLIQYKSVNTSRGASIIGRYPLFVTAVKSGNQRLWVLAGKATY